MTWWHLMLQFICCIADNDPVYKVDSLLVNLAINKTNKTTVIRVKLLEFCHFVAVLNVILKKKPLNKQKNRKKGTDI